MRILQSIVRIVKASVLRAVYRYFLRKVVVESWLVAGVGEGVRDAAVALARHVGINQAKKSLTALLI